MQLAGLHPVVRARAEEAMKWARLNGFTPTITSTKRDWATQERLYATYQRCLANGTFGQPGECRWPANRPGDSAHQFGLAFDSWVPDQFVPVWKEIRQRLGFRVPDHDVIHGEVPDWRTLRPILLQQGITGR